MYTTQGGTRYTLHREEPDIHYTGRNLIYTRQIREEPDICYRGT